MKKIVLLSLCVALLACCKGAPAPQSRIIFDTDLGNDVDDAIALVMLHRYIDQGMTEVLAEGLSKEGPGPVACMDIFNRWYGHPDIPFGTVRDGADCEADAVNYARAVADIYQSEACDSTTVEAHLLYRDILKDQPDGSVTMIAVGFSTNLARLLALDKDLMVQKVRQIVLMAGNFTGEQTSEYNVFKDIASARYIVDNWPGEIVFSPFELGIQVNYPGAVIEGSFSDPEPLTDAYKAYLPMPYDRPCWDPTALIWAVEGESFFTVSEPGTVSISEEGVTTFEPSPEGLHRVLSVTPEQAGVLVEHIVSLTTHEN